MRVRFSASMMGAAIVIVLSQAACSSLKLVPSQKSVYEIAKEVTVVIDGCSSGSGVIFAKEGNTYSVLTARHVVSEDVDCLVITPDGKEHKAKANTFKRYGGLDLAVMQFESDRNYQLGTLEKSKNSTLGQTVYVAGAPEPSDTVDKRALWVTDGKIISTPTEGALGYTLVYNSATKGGMSGGPVLDEKGQVIGIHGRGDQGDGSKGNYGIPIQKFLTAKVSESEADNYLSKGIALYDKGNYKGAILAYNQAIQINPNYAAAYNDRGNARNNLGDYQKALADYNRAIELNPNDAAAYNNRGNARNNLGDYQEALADYNRAIELNPNYAAAYNNRGNARNNLGDYQKALADYNRAIELNPNYAAAYNNRGNARSDLLGDYQKALADYNRAIELNPNYATAYYNRGNVRSKLGEKGAAISDFGKAAELYQQQGKQSDYQDALDRVKKLVDK
ncbi:serine protease [Microcoleus sp. FACHB-53]|nr:serine protease [Microcoleus sp. FACHB-53]